ncbi:NAD(P)H-flavin reductase [uncultured Alteromonas sp.]|jgi:aquacobalamin reductase/NAD(P)H-flavin reductase|uniref:NAD(P)H-flavin reductase n=1 Tax=uncultured Alteromonas sp. TaxID=179113 RepID=UPI0025DF40B1|nr:NAD(P)H-flavin reductase [uncultured Alteromonas sp.]
MSQIRCQVEGIAPLTKTVYRVDLTPDVSLDFQSGQYVLVHMAEDDKRPFSIANAAHDNNRLELHIGAEPGNSYAGEVLERMRQEKAIFISGGHGQATLQDGDTPMILVAGGTGFSYTYSILMQSLKVNPNREITLYWGGKHLEDLYYHKELISLAAHHPHMTYIPVVENAGDDWEGRKGWVHHAVLADYADLSGVQVYIAGRFDMAKVARDDFFERGLSKENLFGDAYAFI